MQHSPRITRSDREGAQRYTQLVAGTPLDDRDEVELEAFARLSTRELDALVADLVAGESGRPATASPSALRRFLRGELGFAAALLATFALVAVLIVTAAAFSNNGIAATTTPPRQTTNSTTTGTTTGKTTTSATTTGQTTTGATTTSHSTTTTLRPGIVTDGGSDW